MQQWKAYLSNEFNAHDLSNLEQRDGDFLISSNSLIYFSWLRTASKADDGFDESKRRYRLEMLEKALRESRRKPNKAPWSCL